MPSPQLIAVSIYPQTPESDGERLALKLNLPFTADPSTKEYAFLLIQYPDYLGIIDTREKNARPFFIDFNSGKIHARGKLAGRKNEMLVKAMGIKPGEQPTIIDSTAGLGRDSFILASVGYHVTMLEKSPIIHALLEDALIRAAHIPTLATIASRMQLVHSDAIQWLKAQSEAIKPDVIYLDPMFPSRQKSALVKKDMVLLQTLLPLGDDNEALFKQAIACTARRVVVKRPRLAENLADQTPTYSITGNSSRFDVYVVKAHGNTPISV